MKNRCRHTKYNTSHTQHSIWRQDSSVVMWCRYLRGLEAASVFGVEIFWGVWDMQWLPDQVPVHPHIIIAFSCATHRNVNSCCVSLLLLNDCISLSLSFIFFLLFSLVKAKFKLDKNHNYSERNTHLSLCDACSHTKRCFFFFFCNTER